VPGLALTLATFSTISAGVQQEQIAYGGWPHCIRLSNAKIELVATTDVGPRVIRLAFIGGKNLFKEWPDQLGKTGGEEWRIYGGHRLWHAPEVKPRTYAPDNDPVTAKWDGRTLRLTQPVEKMTGMQKEIEVTLDPDQARVTVLHRLINHGPWDVETAPWALTVCQGPGRAIIPQEPYISHDDKVLAARTMTLWNYTDMHDPRYTWGTKYVQLRSDPANAVSQKIGFQNTRGWAAFYRDGELFVKRFAYEPTAVYPDSGCNTEVYTSADMLEFETLGPLTPIPPGGSAVHTEVWSLDRVTLGEEDAALDEKLPALVK
jgi:hypothetical protein